MTELSNVSIEWRESRGFLQLLTELESLNVGLESLNLGQLSLARRQAIARPHWRQALSQIAAIREMLCTSPLLDSGTGSVLDRRVQLQTDAISFSCSEFERLELLRQSLGKCAFSLFPWRKGPFRLAGVDINAEWRSDYKFARLAPFVPSLDGLRVLDIGCNNGYYLFRLAGLAESRGEAARLLLGVDPSERYLLQFELLQLFLNVASCEYEPLGIEDLGPLKGQFDFVLCLGIVYHQRDPLLMMQQVRDLLSAGGTALIESQTVPDLDSGLPMALFPPARYAKARNVYFIPTPACLVALAKRAGFVEIEIVSDVELSMEEQRKTELAPYESLEDFLSPENSLLTVEGFPAPRRAAIRVRKPR